MKRRKRRTSPRTRRAALATMGLIAPAGLMVAPAAHAATWGFANASTCDQFGNGGSTDGSFLGSCSGYPGGYDTSTSYTDLIANIDSLNNTAGTSIGQHSTYERFFLGWDAAGTETYNNGVAAGCVASSNLLSEQQGILALTAAAQHALANHERVVIALVVDNHGYDGLTWNSNGTSGSYPSNASLPAALTDANDAGCAAYETLLYMQNHGVAVTSSVAIEAYNEPGNNGVDATQAAADYCHEESQTTKWSDQTIAGVFSSGGYYNSNTDSYIQSYISHIKSDCGSASYWSFHEYYDINNADTQSTDAGHFHQTLANAGMPTGNIWITEASPNNGDCSTSGQAGQAKAWLDLLRSGDAAHVFWYDWPYASPYTGLYNGTACGSQQAGAVNYSYKTLDQPGN